MYKRKIRAKQPTFNKRRVRATLNLRGLTVERLARSAKVSTRHLWFVVTNERPGGAELLAAIRRELGEEGWAFATGATDILRDLQGGASASP